jgi:putative transposase
MPNYQRSRIPGGTYFFTVVAFNRMRILDNDLCRQSLRSAFDNVKKQYPFEIEAICMLPDHPHCIWTLPEQDSDYSKRWRAIKGHFTREYQKSEGPHGIQSVSRLRKGEAAVWQRRFWEHAIRDEEDLHRHLDYIHYNPVKHGLVRATADWPWSSFEKYVQMGFYEKDWGGPVAELGGGSDLFGE